MEKIAPEISLEPEAVKALRWFLAENNITKPIRIEVCFKGCCDPSLELLVDNAGGEDLSLELEGMTIIISPKTQALVGEVTIAYVEEINRRGFRVTSHKPLSEWDGFGLGNIKVEGSF